MDIYFNKFPLMYYKFDINGVPTVKIVRDITTNVRIRRNVLENISLFDEYVMDDEDTPELVAHKYYGSVLLQWVVMLCNQRYDLVRDFPMNQKAFLKYLDDKYATVAVPTFLSNQDRLNYFEMLRVEALRDNKILTLSEKSSSDAVKYVSNTYYARDTLISHYGNYYEVINSGFSEENITVRSQNNYVIWEPDIWYDVGQVVAANNIFYVVKEAGTTDPNEAPNHSSGEAYNGTVLFVASIIFYKKVIVLDIDANLQWATFPTDSEANDYIDKYYTSYGGRVGASTAIHHLHHYEDDDGHIINYTNPEPSYHPLPRVLSDRSEVIKTAVDWQSNTYYPLGTVIKVSENLYYTVTQSGSTLLDTGVPTETIGDITFPESPLVLKHFPLYNEVTNYQYEERLNEEKRHLKLIHKDTLNTILFELKNAIA